MLLNVCLINALSLIISRKFIHAFIPPQIEIFINVLRVALIYI